MRKLLSTITVTTPDMGADAFVRFSLFESDANVVTPNGCDQMFRLVAESSDRLKDPASLPSVMFGATRQELEEVIIEYSRYDDHSEFPSVTDWYDDTGV